MINIPKNRQIKHIGDLQNAITSVILRQTGEFTKEDIYAKVEENIKFSTFGKYGKGRKNNDVKKRIDDTIQTLWVIGSITGKGKGKYILSMSFPAINKR